MNVSELSGATLDYWVARAMGYQTDIKKIKPGGDWCDIELRNIAPPDLTISGENSACDIAMVPNAIREFPACVIGQKIGRGKHPYRSSWFYPSTVWAHGGPIIERECIALDPLDRSGRASKHWQAQVWTPYAVQHGDTPLIAAMRAFVASKYGDAVPDEVN